MAENPIWYRDQLGEGVYKRAPFAEILRQRFDNKFWKGEDLKVNEEVLLFPQEHKLIPVNFPSSLEFLDGLPIDVITYLESSTRSRHAQLGAEVRSAGQIIAESIKEDVYRVRENPYKAYAYVTNHTSRILRINEGSRLFRLFTSAYISPDEIRLRGEELSKQIGKGIKIKGEKGHDWDFAYHTSSDNVEYKSPVGLLLKINPNRKRISPLKYSETIDIPDASGIDYRKIVDGYLEDAPITQIPFHWVSETTAMVTLEKGVNAIIEDHVALAGNLVSLQDGMRHISSHLIDEGFSDKIRVEVVGPTDESADNYVYLQLFRDTNK